MIVKIAQTQKEIIDNFLVRGEVFIIGQNIDWAIEFDGLDQDCVLFTAYLDDKAVGAARLHKTKIGRLATLSSYRKLGVATAIMIKIEEYAKNNGIKELKLNSQYYVKEFYQNLGYIEQGEIFQEANIDHIKMTKVVRND